MLNVHCGRSDYYGHNLGCVFWQLSVVSLITMTVFLRTSLHPDSVSNGGLYLGALFFGLINVMFGGFMEMALIIARLPVYYKQRDLFFYPAWAFALPVYLLRLPISIYESLLWTVITYYTIGFAPEATRYEIQNPVGGWVYVNQVECLSPHYVLG